VNRTRTAIVSIAAAVLLLTACSSAPKADGRPATICDAKAWPQPVPVVAGKLLTDTVDGPLLCFNVTEATAPDGHDALQDPANDTDWTITGVTPAAGTRVTEKQPIALTVDIRNG
jgi:hypothetical protein